MRSIGKGVRRPEKPADATRRAACRAHRRRCARLVMLGITAPHAPCRMNATSRRRGTICWILSTSAHPSKLLSPQARALKPMFCSLEPQTWVEAANEWGVLLADDYRRPSFRCSDCSCRAAAPAPRRGSGSPAAQVPAHRRCHRRPGHIGHYMGQTIGSGQLGTRARQGEPHGLHKSIQSKSNKASATPI